MNYKKCLPFVVLFVFLCSTAFAAPLGDANGNGKVDLGDAVYALQSAAGLRPAGSLRDTIIILQTLIGLSPDINPPSAPVLNTPGDFDLAYYYVRLSWSISTDNVGVAGYYVFRDGVQVGQTTDRTTFIDMNNDTDNVITPDTTYTYKIKAFDAAGNISQGSNIQTVTTSPQQDPIDVSGNV